MPASRRSLAITDAYRLSLVRLRDRVVRAAVDRWSTLDPSELRRSLRTALPSLIAVLELGQAQAADMTAPYLAAFLAEELGEPTDPPEVDTARYVGTTARGRPLRDALLAAVTAARLSRTGEGSGLLRAGGVQVARAVSSEVMDAGRSSLSDAMGADKRIAGWRRVISARPCGACLGDATGTVMPAGSRMRRHPRCACIQEPVVDGVDDTVTRPDGSAVFRRLSPAEQDRLFAGRGGRAKAQLVRSGRVPLDQLVTEQAGGRIHETPTEQLTRA